MTDFTHPVFSLGPNAAAAVCYLAVFLATGHEAHPTVLWSVVLALSGPFWRCFRGLWLLVGLPCGSYLRCAGRPTGEAAWDGLLTHDTAGFLGDRRAAARGEGHPGAGQRRAVA